MRRLLKMKETSITESGQMMNTKSFWKGFSNLVRTGTKYKDTSLLGLARRQDRMLKSSSEKCKSKGYC
jgi:hypothetical protein